MIVEKSQRKALEIKYSGRSTDYLTPTIIFGCGFQCLYCYCKRHKVDGLSIATNLGDILTEVNNHAYFTIIDKPNQTHPMFGKKRTEDTKQKIKNSLLGRKHTEEAKLKMSKSKIK